MPRNNPSVEDRNRIIAAFRQDDDFILLASQLGIKPRTAYSIVKRFRDSGRVVPLRRGGAHNVKIDDQMKASVSAIIEGNPLLTLKELNSKMREILPNKPVVTDTALANAIDGMLYTIKTIADIPDGRNSDVTKDLRMRYATWLTIQGNNAEEIYIDECGFNVYTKRNRGRALRGQFMLPPQGVNLAQHRRSILMRIGDVITAQKCVEWFGHCRTYLPLCIQGQDFPN